ncbi:MAG: HAMP domain-containing histidine kinase [Acidobacteriota bacterium]|nr:HAMP domain-containing histidine kinase [Acidobacteriota bacterium]
MTTRRASALGLRGRLLLSALAALAAVLLALTVAFNLVLAGRLDHEATGVVQARASAEIATLVVSHGRILLPEAPDNRSPDTQVWVFQGARPIEQPQTGQANDAAAVALAFHAPSIRDVARTDVRLLAMPVVQSGRRVGAVVAGISLAPYEQTRRTALVASVLLALTVLLAFGVTARWLIDRALRLVARMTQQAAEWSEHDLDRRFALGPPTDELTQLAGTLDDLLDRIAASLRREQRLSAEISHELRTPLASITAEAQYALRHGRHSTEGQATLEHILLSARALARTLDTLLAAARAQLDPRRASSDAAACVHAAIDTGIAREVSGELRVSVIEPPEPLRVAVEHDLVERILAPLLDNAARHAQETVEITIAGDGDAVSFTVQDDGPGIPADQREAIFEPGYRVTDSGATVTLASRGAGLGLALCRRLARTAGGDVHALASEPGARFTVQLPRA